MTRHVIFVHNTSHYLKLHYTELINSFMAQGCIVTCLAPKDDATAALEGSGVRCVHISLDRRGLNPFRELMAIIGFMRLFNKLRPDAVLNFSIKPAIYSSLAARIAKVPKVCSMITGMGYVFLGSSRSRQVLARLVQAAYRLALSGNHKVFFQNPDDADYFIGNRMVRTSQSMVLAGTGVNTDHFRPTESRSGNGQIKFLMVARLLSDKGIREFVEVARMLHREGQAVRCSLLGSFDDNPSAVSGEELESWIAEDVIDYLGEMEDVRGALGACDVFVLPSYREGLPRAILEAMAMGKPVVTTDVPGCRETVVPDVNGFLVPPRDTMRLKEAMQKFIDNQDLVEKMGGASRNMAEDRFEVNNVNAVVTGVVLGA